MAKLALGALALLAIAGAAFLYSEVPSPSSSDIMQLLEQNQAILLDVREESEILSGMAAPAQWFPTSKILASEESWQQFLAQLPHDKKIFIYCASGVRADKIAARLASAQIAAANIGGFRDWLQAGLPTTIPKSTPAEPNAE